MHDYNQCNYTTKFSILRIIEKNYIRKVNEKDAKQTIQSIACWAVGATDKKNEFVTWMMGQNKQPGYYGTKTEQVCLLLPLS